MRSILNTKRYMKDYNIERPDSDYPGYEDYFKEGSDDDEWNDEEVFEDDDIDEW